MTINATGRNRTFTKHLRRMLPYPLGHCRILDAAGRDCTLDLVFFRHALLLTELQRHLISVERVELPFTASEAGILPIRRNGIIWRRSEVSSPIPFSTNCFQDSAQSRLSYSAILFSRLLDTLGAKVDHYFHVHPP